VGRDEGGLLRTAADHGSAVHKPDHNLSAGHVAPEDVGIAITIEVPGPVGRDKSLLRTAADHGSAIHKPDHNLSAGHVAPEDVGIAVAVEVAGPGDGPGAYR